MEEVTATELAWITQLVDALDRAWESYHSDYSSISNLWHSLTPTRRPIERRDEDLAATQPTQEPAHALGEAPAEAMEDNRGRPSPRAALAAARAALAAAEAEAEAIDWGSHKVSTRVLSSMCKFPFVCLTSRYAVFVAVVSWLLPRRLLL